MLKWTDKRVADPNVAYSTGATDSTANSRHLPANADGTTLRTNKTPAPVTFDETNQQGLMDKGKAAPKKVGKATSDNPKTIAMPIVPGLVTAEGTVALLAIDANKQS